VAGMPIVPCSPPSRHCECPPERQKEARTQPKAAVYDRGQSNGGWHLVYIYCHRVVEKF